MTSTFTSLETMRRALFTSQLSIQTTGHNIANAGTDGYSRQRVNLETTLPYPSVGFNRPQIPGQIGTGVQASTIERIRDSFVDTQVRQEMTKTGYWSARSDALSQMEDIMNEPTDQSLSTVIDQFWQSLQDLASNPDNNSGARSVVRQRGIAVAETFHYLSSSLAKVQDNLKTEIGVNIDKVNSLIRQINDINKQIAEVEPNGYSPNDLYDKRDQLVDELSQYVNVKVIQEKTGGNAPATAAGTYTIQLIARNDAGTSSVFTLVDGKNLRVNPMKVDFSGTTPSLTVDGKIVTETGGNIQGLMESYTVDYPNMLDRLNQMAYQLVTEFNKVHEQGDGIDPDGTGTIPTGIDFFTPLASADNAASLISVSQDILDSVNNIAAAGKGMGSGDNTNAQALADVLANTPMTFTMKNGDTYKGTFKSFLESTIGEMGVNAQSANRMKANCQTLQDTAEQRRQSISGVSIDEEMTNLIQFQHTYSAAARMTSIINEMLDTIIRLGQ